MADLFDYKVDGLGWHLTSHLIAIVALFVACFAITGYITFRDESIDVDKLNILNSDREVRVVSINHNGGITEKVYTVVIDGALAVRSDSNDSIVLIASGFGPGMHIVESGLEVLTATDADLGALTIEIGTAANYAVDGGGGTPITGGATLAATNTAGIYHGAIHTGA